jgi:FAD/FMN-containing dehydrogenases
VAISNIRLTGRIVLPDDPNYENARTDYNTRFSKYPCVIVFCQRVQDVINAVKWARKNHVPIRARCGGHSYEAFSIVNKGRQRLKKLKIKSLG